MHDNGKLKVVLYWHMHQPDYRNYITGIYQQPWTYLHAIKDYVDMVMHLEAEPRARVVINFTPILLEQIDDYAKQVTAFLKKHTITGILKKHKLIKDPLLSALAEPSLPSNLSQRLEIINWCARANEKRIIQRFPAYHRLIKITEDLKDSPEIIEYLNDQCILDLLVWYHLGWLAEHVRRSDIRIKRLLKKEHNFTYRDRIKLLTVISELLNSIIPRYRALAESKQIELSTTPYAHPIIPLLINFDTTLEAMPHAPMPEHKSYPGGVNRAKWHIKKSIKIFKKHFGFEPVGCWPSEGAISKATCELLQEYGFKWIASGAGVFWNSIKSVDPASQLSKNLSEHMPNQLPNQEIVCYFRDDRLSDFIGFEYSSWHADDAVANLINSLKEIANQESNNHEIIVSIILDGENAWEHYPENGYYFLNALYAQLAEHPELELTTYSNNLASNDIKIQQLPNLVAGSWVYGTLSTWIGSKDKNRGWDMLCDAKQCYDKVITAGNLSKEEIKQAVYQLSICEGSDWFWWFGDYNSAETVSDFEKLFRQNLTNLYKLLHKTPPEYLSTTFTFGKGSPTGGGSMRKSG